MSAKTGIGWTDSTWNPWVGCTRVSPGCAHCYMFREQERYGQDPTIVRRSRTTFSAPLRWKDPRMIFTCSWSDWFHEGADAWREDAWEIIKRSPHHTFQILTKRPERISEHLPPDWGDGYPNVWLGVSVENSRWMERATTLANIPAAVRFISAEPLLGPVSASNHFWFPEPLGDEYQPLLTAFQWAIIGGESGPDGVRRPMEIAWMQAFADECTAHNVAVFIKQDSHRRDSMQGNIPDGLWARKEWPNGQGEE